MTNTEPYTQLARVYDAIFNDVEYEDWCEFVLHVLATHDTPLPPQARVLDLACGTAASSSAYIAKGHRVTGVDASAAMLAVAQEKFENTNFVQQDFLNLSLPTRFDLVICVFDSLNNLLTPQELEQAFARVFEHLKPGAWFAFDINTPIGVRELWEDNRMAGSVNDGDHDIFFDWQHQHDTTQDLGIVTAHCWGQDQHGVHFDFKETHLERGYWAEETLALLRGVGFGEVFALEYPDMETPNEDAPRIWCFAKKAA